MKGLTHTVAGTVLYNPTLAFATKAHAGQFRADGVTPCIVHPVEVSNLLITWSSKVQIPYTAVIVALLHDVIEDTKYTLEDLNTIFGWDIAYAVFSVSKDPNGDREETLERLRYALMDAKLVKYADICCNSKTIFESKGRDKAAKWLEKTNGNMEVLNKSWENCLTISEELALQFARDQALKALEILKDKIAR